MVSLCFSAQVRYPRARRAGRLRRTAVVTWCVSRTWCAHVRTGPATTTATACPAVPYSGTADDADVAPVAWCNDSSETTLTTTMMMTQYSRSQRETRRTYNQPHSPPLSPPHTQIEWSLFECDIRKKKEFRHDLLLDASNSWIATVEERWEAPGSDNSEKTISSITIEKFTDIESPWYAESRKMNQSQTAR